MPRHPSILCRPPTIVPRCKQVTVKDIYASAGSGFLVVSLGAISFIPGLPIKPAYYKIDLDLSEETPKVLGLS